MIGRGLMVAVLAAMALPAIPAQAQVAGVDCAKAKCLALTFDDGPGPQTPKLLKVLKKEKVKATFFVVGKQVERRPAVLKQTVAAGHAVGNHTYSHPSMPTLSEDEIFTELRATQELITSAAGITAKMFRPPYGHADERVVRVAGDEGLAQVKWTGTTLDWQLRDVKKIKAAVLRLARKDGVILMHDTVPQTVQAMPAIIKELKKRGYTLVTFPQLLRGKKLTAGAEYP
ncbi:polysaccharide deacetylase family protein [Nonomuraea sp. NBC_01738]|uniref:polysaccharide deacetylase family protein n=1 Tax=Nonomuraea sp. NBC_01738 TaxID=2976003 RepID=UPI002E13F81C|nr:polysaccharide deacetylase family protein [Nonomuraea sp. NBC_01738]